MWAALHGTTGRQVHTERVLEWAGATGWVEGTDRVEVLEEWAELVDPLHVGCENKGNSKMLSLERRYSLRRHKTATADQKRAVVPEQSRGMASHPSLGSDPAWHLVGNH